MENNVAFIAKISNIRAIEGADKIVRASVILHDVPVAEIITSVDTKDGQLVAYFDSNMQLLSDLLNDYPDYAKYLGKNNRVKNVKLRGVISCGLVVEVENLYRYFNSKEEAVKTLVEGFSFLSIGNKELCKKYEVPKARNSGIGQQPQKKKEKNHVISGMFPEHIDTQQLYRNAHKITPDSIISISQKIHGTSSRYAFTKVRRPLSGIERFIKKVTFGKVKFNDTEWCYVSGSRRVTKSIEANKIKGSSFYPEDIYTKSGEKYFYGKLHKGEMVFYEIVGYMPESQTFIQKNFDYGCAVGEYKIAVYRIAMMNEDGVSVEYSWEAMKARCIELDVPMVPEYYRGKAKDKYPEIEVDENWNKNFVEKLKEDYLEKDLEGNLSAKVPDEGIVIKVESLTPESYKLKSEAFYLYETKASEEGIEDIEEMENITDDEEEFHRIF